MSSLYPKVPPENRLSKVCENPAGMNEKHFLVECSGYNTLRNELFTNLNIHHLTNDEKFKQCLKEVDTRTSKLRITRAELRITYAELRRFLRNQCRIPQCFAELRKGFTTCGTCSTSHIRIFSASIWKICGKFRLGFFT